MQTYPNTSVPLTSAQIYFTIPAIQHYGFPFTITSQIVRCLQLLYQISTLDDPAWNSSDVRSSIDILATMDLVISNLSQVPAMVSLSSPEDSGEDVFTRSAHQFRSLRTSWAAALSHRAEPSSSTTMPENLAIAGGYGVPEEWEISWLSGDWWAEFPLPQ